MHTLKSDAVLFSLAFLAVLAVLASGPEFDGMVASVTSLF